MTDRTIDLNICLRLKVRLALFYGLAIAILPTVVISRPEATFPFNDQVPLVARVGESYNFTLSATTFSSRERIIQYSLEENPTWLRIDPISRVLSGVPKEEDVGPFDFDILAMDTTGVSSMPARLIVAFKPIHSFGNEMREQLERHGYLNGPNSILLSPSQRFELNFGQKSDQGAKPRLSYYATMMNHSPLPPWIIFDNKALRFHGVAPSFEEYPREYNLLLIASDIPGYAGAFFDFSLVLSDHDFRFIPQRNTLTITPGESFEFAGLRDAVYMDRRLAKINELRSIRASPPSNLHFEARNFVVKGVAASEPQTFSIIAKDQYDNIAECTLTISPEPKEAPRRKTVSAFRGSHFKYGIPQALISQHQQMQINFGEAASWLDFDENNHLIHGYVPSKLKSSLVTIAIETSFAETKVNETHELILQIESEGSAISFSPSHSAVSSPSPPNAIDNIADKMKGKEKRQSKKSVLAIAVSISFALFCLILAISIIIFRKYRVRSKFKRSLDRRNISLPVSQLGAHQNDFNNLYTCNNEDSQEIGNFLNPRQGNPPQLSPVIRRRSSKRRSWQQAIFDPNQEAEMTNLESHYDKDYTKLSKPRSFISSRTGQATDFKLREKCNNCNSNAAASYTPQPLIVYPGDRHSPIYGDSVRDQRCHQCNKVPLNELRHIPSSSMLSRSISMTSFTPSVFPAPPLLTKAFYRRSTPIPLKPNSIRLVPKTPSSLALVDSRTISEKRQSYIRARVSGPSPFFSAGSYKKSIRLTNGQNSKAQTFHNQSSSSNLQWDCSHEEMSDSVLTRSPSLATAEREIEEFWINYSSATNKTTRRERPLKRLYCQGFVKDSLEKLEGSSQYTATPGTTSLASVSGQISPAKMQADESMESIRPISTKLVDRPHPLVGRRAYVQRRKTRMKSFLYLPTSKLRKRSAHAGPASSYLGDETCLDLNTKKGLGIVLDLSSYERSEDSANDCNYITRSRSPLSEISNGSPQPRLVGGKGKRPVSVQGNKHEGRWGSLSGLRGNDAFI